MEISHVDNIDKWETTARYKNFIVVEDQENLVSDFLKV